MSTLKIPIIEKEIKTLQNAIVVLKVEKISYTIPLKPLASAPFRTESDISVTAAKSTLDPAVLTYRATKLIVLASAEAIISANKRKQDLQFFLDHQSIVLTQRTLCRR